MLLHAQYLVTPRWGDGFGFKHTAGAAHSAAPIIIHTSSDTDMLFHVLSCMDPMSKAHADLNRAQDGDTKSPHVP